MARRDLPASPPEVQSDPATIEALKEIHGTDQVVVQSGEMPDGKPIFAEGYHVMPDGEHVFKNDLRQSCHVPPHRVKQELEKAKAPTVAKPATVAK